MPWYQQNLERNVLFQELKHLHPTVHVHIISRLLDKHPNLHADTSWDVLAKQLFMNYPKVNIWTHFSAPTGAQRVNMSVRPFGPDLSEDLNLYILVCVKYSFTLKALFACLV